MLRSISVLQEGRAWTCGGVFLKSTEPQTRPGSAVLLQQNPPVPFNCLQRKMLATPAHSFAVSTTTLYWKKRVYGDQRSPRNEVGVLLGFPPNRWDLLAPDVSRRQAKHSHSPSLPFLPKSSFSASEVRCCPGKSSPCKEIELGLIALPELLISGREGAGAELTFSMWV